MPSRAWDHSIEVLPIPDSVPDSLWLLASDINEFADDGWELVSAAIRGDEVWLLLRRPHASAAAPPSPARQTVRPRRLIRRSPQ